MVHEVFDDVDGGPAPAAASVPAGSSWEHAFAAALDPMVIVDDERRVIDANPAAGELLGYAPEELIGNTITSVIAPRHRERVTRAWTRFILAGSGRGEWLLVTRGGELLEIEASAAANFAPGSHLMVLRDITARKRAEAETQRRAEQHAAVAEIGRVALSSTSATDLMQNAAEEIARVLEVDFVKVLQLHARGRDLILRAGVGWATGTVGDETVTGTASKGEFVISAREPVVSEDLREETRFEVPPLLREHGVISGVSVVIEGGERPFGVLGVHSRTARKWSADDIYFLRSVANLLGAALARERLARLETKLEQAHRLESVGQLAGGIAHDFNNLLGVIQSYSSFALQGLHPDDQAYRDISEVAAAATHGADLAKQLLQFSSRQVVQTRVVDPNNVVATTAAMLERTIGAHIELRIDCEPGVAAVRIGHGQLEQVVMNLSMNARDAMKDGGLLQIATEMVELEQGDEIVGAGLAAGRYVLVSVSDTGTGMSPEVADQALEPFFTTKERGKGTGLGLATIYGIAQAADGRVLIDSEPGQGTTVGVYLPASEAAAVAELDANPSELQGFGEVVLLVEDDHSGRRATERILRENGYFVIALGSPEAALQVAERADRIDVLLTDLMMPRLSGVELARRIRELNRGIGVAFISGYVAGALPDGVSVDAEDPLIEKPFTASSLLAGVRIALGTSAQDDAISAA